MGQSWFKAWFGDAYKQLYPHRNYSEASAQVNSLLNALPANKNWRILDIGCGQGRHLDTMHKLGYQHCVGLDLSHLLLLDAKQSGLKILQGDMRYLPFRHQSYNLVTSFFTSFGYFPTLEEDIGALAQFVSVLKPNGYLFLDLLNKDFLEANLIADDRRILCEKKVNQSRRIEIHAHPQGAILASNAVVIKDIKIENANGDIEKFEERVRLYTLNDMQILMQHFSLTLIHIFGNEKGEEYNSLVSPRMSLLLQLKAT